MRATGRLGDVRTLERRASIGQTARWFAAPCCVAAERRRALCDPKEIDANDRLEVPARGGATGRDRPGVDDAAGRRMQRVRPGWKRPTPHCHRTRPASAL